MREFCKIKSESLLFILSFEGIVEVKMLEQLMEKFRLIECTVVEPSDQQITSHKKHVDKQKDSLHGVTFDFRKETIQEFCKANADGSKEVPFCKCNTQLLLHRQTRCGFLSEHFM